MPKSTPSIQVSSFPAKVTRWLFLALAITTLQGCTSLIVDPLVTPFERSLEQQENLDLLHDGAPTLLLMIDGLLVNDPTDPKMLIRGVKAYSSYAMLLTQYQETEQAQRCAERGRELAQTLLAGISPLADYDKTSPDNLPKLLAGVDADEVAPLFWGAYGWAVWVQLQQGSPAGLVALPRIEPIMNRVVELDESFNHGGAHIFLGALYGSKPALLGGKPKVSLAHFEKALTLANRQFLPTQVTFAETYARQIFDRKLFKSLLEEVLATPLDDAPHLKASNSLAKMRARQLLDSIDEFF